jgi:hypothetical protein
MTRLRIRKRFKLKARFSRQNYAKKIEITSYQNSCHGVPAGVFKSRYMQCCVVWRIVTHFCVIIQFLPHSNLQQRNASTVRFLSTSEMSKKSYWQCRLYLTPSSQPPQGLGYSQIVFWLFYARHILCQVGWGREISDVDILRPAIWNFTFCRSRFWTFDKKCT